MCLMSMGHMGKYETVCSLNRLTYLKHFNVFAELRPWQTEQEKAFNGILKSFLVSVGKTSI